jgi:lipoprotein-anchoring transpeptidase ErfK/SrfK
VALPTAWVLPEHERRGIIVNLAELRLYHFPEPDTVPNVHTIGIGRDGFTTPLGYHHGHPQAGGADLVSDRSDPRRPAGVAERGAPGARTTPWAATPSISAFRHI